MLRLPPKRIFYILLPCILIIGAMIPLATFAATPKHQAAVVATETTSTVTVTNRCVTPPVAANAPEGPQTLVTLNKGQEIEGSAVMQGNDLKVEEEALAVYELNGPAALLVKANFPARNFEFTAHTNNIQVVVCFVQIGGDDDQDFNVPQSAFILDHPASVKFEVEQAGTNDAETNGGI